MATTADAAAAPRLQPLGVLRGLQFHSCELVLLTYFVSNTVYKRWYIATAFALVVTVALGMLGQITLRGAIRAMVPFALYHGYLLTAIYRTEYRSLVAFNTLADVILLAVVFLFWSLIRNYSVDRVSAIFSRIPYIAVVAAVFEVATGGIGNRVGGIGLVFLPLSVPFCYERLVSRKQPRLALIALLLAFALLAISRSRSPFAASVIALGLSFLFIGAGIRVRIKALVLGTLGVGVVVSGMMLFGATRFMLLTAYVRFTGNEILRPDLWIPAEQPDMVRVRLNELVMKLLPEAQPFGIGMGAVAGEYARLYGETVAVHNTYHAWAVEGGLFCVLIVLWILMRHARAILRAMRDPALRRFALALTFSTLAILAMANFHQMHRAPALWLLLGMGAGLRSRLSRVRPGNST